MSKNISLLGADYPAVPAVQLPQTGGGTATFYDITVVDNLNSSSSTDALSAKQGKVLNDTTPKVDSAGVKIVYGSDIITAGTDRKRFDFGVTFTNIPSVFITPVNSGNGAIILTTFDIHKDYAVALFRQGSASSDQGFDWMAIGV